MVFSLDVQITEKKQGTVLSLSGQLTRATSKKLSYLFNEMVFENLRYCALNLKNLDYIDAKGIGIITQLMNHLQEKGIPFYAHSMNNEIFDILDIVDLTKGLKLFADEKEFEESVLEICT